MGFSPCSISILNLSNDVRIEAALERLKPYQGDDMVINLASLVEPPA